MAHTPDYCEAAGQDLPQLGSKTPEQTSTDDEDSEPMDLDDRKLFFWVDGVPDFCEAEQDLPQRRGAETPSSRMTINLSIF